MNTNTPRNKRKFKERYEKFIVSFLDLNEDIFGDMDSEYKECDKLPCRRLTITGDGSKEIILPNGYEVIDNINNVNSMEDTTYICDKASKVVCGVSLVDNKAYPRNNFVTYKEYILEKASIITEDYFGNSKEDYLKVAILKMMDGNYNYFTKYDNTRFKLVLLSRSNIPRIMLSTLKRKNIRGAYSTINSVTDLYVNYIKDKVKSIHEQDNTKAYVKVIK